MREARLRLWIYLLLAVAAVVVVFTVAAGVFLTNAARAFLANQPASRAAVSEVSANSKEVATLRAQREQLLQTLGGLSGAHLYQAYLNIGLLADGVESKNYTEAEARKMLETVTAMLDTVDQQLARIKDAGLEPDDQKAIQRIHALSPLLHEQARTLLSYWKNRSKENVDQYHTARETTWRSLSEVLGLKAQ
jgi:hypothetical protein